MLIQAATDYVQVACNRALSPQTWEITYPGYPSGGLPIPGNVRNIVSVEGLVSGTYTPMTYVAHYSEPAVIEVTEAVALDCSRSAIKVVADVGYDTVPDAIISAMLLLIGGWFNNRQSTIVGTSAGTVPMSVEYLLFPYRDGRIM